LPTGDTGRPKSGQLEAAESNLRTGKPSENCNLEIFSLGREPAVQL
jgi:hypothetical protein